MSKKNINNIVSKEDSDDDISDIIEDVDDIIDDNFEENTEIEEEYNELDDNYEFEEDEPQDCILEKIIENDIDDVNNNSEIEEIITEENLLKGEDRISFPRLTKYEMVRILGERTKQLKKNGKALIKDYKGLKYSLIAVAELKLNMTPYKIKRPLPNGKYEIWALEELFKDHLMNFLETYDEDEHNQLLI